MFPLLLCLFLLTLSVQHILTIAIFYVFILYSRVNLSFDILEETFGPLGNNACR